MDNKGWPWRTVLHSVEKSQGFQNEFMTLDFTSVERKQKDALKCINSFKIGHQEEKL